MSLSNRGMRFAYAIYGSLALLVLGAIGWATVASLRLEHADEEAEAERDYKERVRVAMSQMENWANQILATELSREYWHYLAYYTPNPSDVRLRSGEIHASDSLVQVSPLFKDPPQWSWTLLHFQVSRQGFVSPQLVPDDVRDWPGFESDFDTWNRKPYAQRLDALRRRYSMEQLARMYERSRGGPAEVSDESISEPAIKPGDQAEGRQQLAAASPRAPDYARRKERTDQLQRSALPQTQCAPEELALANILDTGSQGARSFNDESAAVENEIGIAYHHMRPIWLTMDGDAAPNLCFLRAVDFGFEIAWQGFLIDWTQFQNELLKQAAEYFPNASIERLDPTQPWPSEDSVFSLIPARFISNEQPTTAIASAGWNSTHTFLAIGWAGALTLLFALGVAIRSLVMLSERRSQFAYAVTHELRTPLTTFRLYTDMLSQGLVSEEHRQQYLDTLNQESRRLADLVTGVLEYSRIENHCVPVNRSPTRVGEILETVRQNCQPRCQSAQMELRISADGVESDVLNTDKQLVTQIIANLVDNACKYGRGAAEPAVTVTARRRNGTMMVDVLDNGPGIRPRDRLRIFRPYNRAAADPATVTGGIGLGLALSRSWARLLGGQLELSPNGPNEQGARFRLVLPNLNS